MNFMYSEEKEIELVLLYKCNWDCSYCCVDTHNQPTVKKETISEKLNLIFQKYPDYNVTLSGGEIGLLSYEEILTYINKFKQYNIDLSLNTNGTFLKKYPELIEEFSSILYHCSPEMKDRDVLLNLPLNVQYMIVITDDNLCNVDSFLSYYKDIKFHLVAASNPDKINKPILSKKNRIGLLSKYINQSTRESQLRLISEKNFDDIIYL